MKYCTNCGNPLGDEKFCTKCGTKVEEAITNSTSIEPAYPPTVKGKSKIILFIPVVILAIVVVLAFALFGGKSYKSVIKTYVTASIHGDAKKMVSLLPDKFVDYLIDEEGFSGKKELINSLQDELDMALSEFEELGIKTKDIKVSYEITNETDLRGEEWREIRDELKDEADIDIDAAKEVDLKLKIKFLGMEDEENTQIKMVKIGRSWYIIDM